MRESSPDNCFCVLKFWINVPFMMSVPELITIDFRVGIAANGPKANDYIQ